MESHVFNFFCIFCILMNRSPYKYNNNNISNNNNNNYYYYFYNYNYNQFWSRWYDSLLWHSLCETTRRCNNNNNNNNNNNYYYYNKIVSRWMEKFRLNQVWIDNNNNNNNNNNRKISVRSALIITTTSVCWILFLQKLNWTEPSYRLLLLLFFMLILLLFLLCWFCCCLCLLIFIMIACFVLCLNVYTFNYITTTKIVRIVIITIITSVFVGS